MASRIRFVVKGRVQGIGFRWFVVETAGRLGIAGWVRNLPGGDVEGEAEGGPEALEAFLSAIRSEHPVAHVSALETQPQTARGETGFRITR